MVMFVSGSVRDVRSVLGFKVGACCGYGSRCVCCGGCPRVEVTGSTLALSLLGLGLVSRSLRGRVEGNGGH